MSRAGTRIQVSVGVGRRRTDRRVYEQMREETRREVEEGKKVGRSSNGCNSTIRRDWIGSTPTS